MLLSYCMQWDQSVGKIATGGRSLGVSIWDFEAGEVVENYVGHAGNVYALDYQPSVRSCATAGKDGSIKLWDTTSGLCTATMLSHTGSVMSVKYDPASFKVAI